MTPSEKRKQNMTPKYKQNQEITIHRDGTVSYFSIYLQQWQRVSAEALVGARDFLALTSADRTKINAASRRQLA